MKRLVLFVLALLYFLMLVGCEIKQEKYQDDFIDSSETIDVESEFDDWGLRMDILPISSTQFEIIFSHNSEYMKTEGDLTTDPSYEIHAIYNNDTITFGDYMRNVLKQSYEDQIYAWNTILYLINNDTETSYNIDLYLTYGKLPIGEYVISKNVMLTTVSGEMMSRVYTTSFSVVE